MWFKNLVLYRFTERAGIEPEALAAALADHAFRPCGGLDHTSYGWDRPAGRLGTELVHAAAGCILVCARRESKILPPAVVREEVEERVARAESQDRRSVSRKERSRMRDDVIFDLLPRAFVRSQRTFAYLAPEAGWLVVDAATPRRAEELVVLLGESLRHLPVVPYASESDPFAELTRWLGERGPPRGFHVQEECELRDPAREGARVVCLRQDLASREIRTHLAAGKQVQRVALGLDERLSFVLCADLTVRRLRFDLARESGSSEVDDEMAAFDMDFAYMTAEIGGLLKRLEAVFPPRG